MAYLTSLVYLTFLASLTSLASLDSASRFRHSGRIESHLESCLIKFTDKERLHAGATRLGKTYLHPRNRNKIDLVGVKWQRRQTQTYNIRHIVVAEIGDDGRIEFKQLYLQIKRLPHGRH